LTSWASGPFRVTTDAAELDVELIHGFLRRSYWAEGIAEEVVRRSIHGSLCFGLFEHDRQVGFARVVTDRATFAYLADVFVLESHRGRGLAAWLMECVTSHAELQGLRRWSLVTRDAHGLYRKFGFQALAHPDRHMTRDRPGMYLEAEAS
jgi:GNAT superfamily N-acetyltransferase